MTRLVMVGGGRMGEALLGGLIGSGWATASELAVVEPVPSRRDELAARYPGLTVTDEPRGGDGVVLAVKPHQIEEACHALAGLDVGRVLSIAAGVTLDRLEFALGSGVPVVRAMPNTPALVGAGAAAIAGGLTLHAASLLGTGIAAGAIAAHLLSWLIDVTAPVIPLEYSTGDLLLVATLLSASGLFASIVPVLRLKNIDPLEAFRS
jgi:pyrroline-5-carboxylate reductase